MSVELVPAGPGDLEALLPLVAGYHAFEGIGQPEALRRRTVARLLAEPALGAIWRIEEAGHLVGYAALCFGFSIEFGGRDAFLDELYLVEAARGRGVGRQVLEALPAEAAAFGVVALHLEVARDNAPAISAYRRTGFALRDKYALMSLRLTEEDEGSARP